MRMYDIIAKKRDGYALSKEEIGFFVSGYTSGEIPDYQASALLMAIYLNKMSYEETSDLTLAMMKSGNVIDLSAIKGVKVDKHSTGGVGDKTTLVLAPLVASCGVPVAKMSGRGLGHTGGTIDKLESIEGFKIEASVDEFIRNVNKNKVSIIGQSKNIAPADKKIYALRDVTATVDNVSLIAASIMSKKLASGSDAIVLDVKCGSGAFVKTLDEAVHLSQAMVNIGTYMAREVVAVITDMDQPLGFGIGNAIEVKESVDTLLGNGPEDLTELCKVLGAHMLVLGKAAVSYDDGYSMIEEKIRSKEAYRKFKEFVGAQGGNVSQIEDTSLLPLSAITHSVASDRDGYVHRIESEHVGIAAMFLGAGRETLESAIDMGAGIVLRKKVGDFVKKGETIAQLYTSDPEKLQNSEDMVKAAYSIKSEKADRRKLIIAIVTKDSVTKL